MSWLSSVLSSKSNVEKFELAQMASQAVCGVTRDTLLPVASFACVTVQCDACVSFLRVADSQLIIIAAVIVSAIAALL